jgi:dienelactone hydrolase
MGGMWNIDTVQSLVRAVLKIGGGYLLARGLADGSTIEALIAGALALVAVLLLGVRTDYFHYLPHRNLSSRRGRRPSLRLRNEKHLALPVLSRYRGRMFLDRFGIVSAHALLILAPISSPSAELPVEAFFRNPEYRDVRLSPDGNNLAVLAPVKSRVGLAVIDLQTSAANWAFSDRTADVMWLEWATTNRLIFGLGRDGYPVPGLQAVNRDSSSCITLLVMGDGSRRFLSLLPGLPDEFLIGSVRNSGRASDTLLRFPNVERMNIYSGAAVAEVKNPGHVFFWTSDHSGVVRAAVAIDGKLFRVLYRTDAHSPWITLSEYDYEQGGIEPVGFEYDNRTLLVKWFGGQDTEGIYTYDPEAKAIKTLAFRHATADVDRLIFSKKKRALVGVTLEAEKPEVYWFDPDYRRMQASVDSVLTNTFNKLVSRNEDESRAVFLATNDRTPGTYYLVDMTSLRLQRLFDVAEWIDPAEMAVMKPIKFTARDGLKIHGYLTLPKGSEGKSLPMVVRVHGGPAARDTWGFDSEVQFFANRGYAVLQVNFRGSTGYGASFLRAGFKEWGLKQQDDITDGVKWAISQGIADPERIAIYGASYGGYAALIGLEKTPQLYRCGICFAGVTDIKRTIDRPLPMLDMTRNIMALTVGDPRTEKLQLKEKSPLQNCDLIQVPVLLAYGELDDRVPINTGRDLAKALKKRGKLYDFIVKSDEGHGFHKEANRIDFWTKVDEFLKAQLLQPSISTKK